MTCHAESCEARKRAHEPPKPVKQIQLQSLNAGQAMEARHMIGSLISQIDRFGVTGFKGDTKQARWLRQQLIGLQKKAEQHALTHAKRRAG